MEEFKPFFFGLKWKSLNQSLSISQFLIKERIKHSDLSQKAEKSIKNQAHKRGEIELSINLCKQH